MNWRQIEEHVSQLPYQQDEWVPKGSVVPPEVAGIPYTYGAYRKTLPDGKAIDIKPYAGGFLTHWDRYNPDTHLIEHALYDASGEWLLFTTLTGAAVGVARSPKGKKDEGAVRGATIGLGVGAVVLLLKEIAAQN